MSKFKSLVRQILDEVQEIDSFIKLKSILSDNPGFYRQIKIMERRYMKKYIDKPINTSDYIDMGENTGIEENKFYFYTAYQYLENEEYETGEIGFDLYEFKNNNSLSLIKKYHHVFTTSKEWETFRYKYIDEKEIRKPKINLMRTNYKRQLGITI